MSTFLALGDSYTIGESVAANESWPFQLVQKLRLAGIRMEDPQIIATTGWTTSDLKNAIDASTLAPSFDYVSLLIGVNNQYQGKSVKDYSNEFEELLQFALSKAASRDGVFVLSIPDYGFTPFGIDKKETISQAIDEFNGWNKRLTRKAGVHYVDITSLSRTALEDPRLIATDGLHPSGLMYNLWVNEILNKVFHLIP